MNRSHSVTWLTSPPAKHLHNNTNCCSSQTIASPSADIIVNQESCSNTPAQDTCSSTARIPSLPLHPSSNPPSHARLPSLSPPQIHPKRKRRKPGTIVCEQEPLSSLQHPPHISSLGFTSLLRECQSAFVATPSHVLSMLQPPLFQEGDRIPSMISHNPLLSPLCDSGCISDKQSRCDLSTHIHSNTISDTTLDSPSTTSHEGHASRNIINEPCLPAVSTDPLLSTSDTSNPVPKQIQKVSRLVVLESIVRNISGSPTLFEKAVRVLDEDLSNEILVVLRDEWLSTDVNPGDYIHIKSKTRDMQEIVINSNDGIIIVHPDHLVTVTAISESFSCLRRAILKSKVKFRSTNASIVFGNIVHELFQEALRQHNFSVDFLKRICITLLSKNIDELYAISMSEECALEELYKMMAPMREWADTFLHKRLLEPENAAGNEFDLPTSSIHHLKQEVCQIDSIVDIEETIWSHTYGIKGQVDVLATARLGKEQSHLIPIELKTSKRTNHMDSHRAQTMIYSLIMSDIYNQDILNGVLAYICRNESLVVPLRWNEIQMMIIMRNTLASHSVKRGRTDQPLPAVIQNEWICRKCYMLDICTLYQKKENHDLVNNGLNVQFREIWAQISPKHVLFFNKWDTFITSEEPNMEEFSREFFTLSSHERAKLGRCIENLQVICPIQPIGVTDTLQKTLYELVQIKKEVGPGILNCEIVEGDPVILSKEKTRQRLGNGYVVSISHDCITVAMVKPLKPSAFQTDDLCRLDKDQFASGSSSVRYYLTSIFTEQRFFKCRQLIVDLAPPQFTPRVMNRPDMAGLNVSQLNAVDRVMRAQDYALILGMPGTGKTTVIGHILKLLIQSGKSILLTSYTHSAVDNILLKIKDTGIAFLRMGDIGKVHPSLKNIVEEQRKQLTTVAQAEQYYTSVPIVATTCLSLNHPIFSKRRFDYCIVDEASQIILPVCLGPIRLANVFILVGDHYQLPPIATQSSPSDEPPPSLFRYLSEAHPSAVAVMEQQYRMNKDIMSLASTTIYNSKLRCGSDVVSSQRIDLPLWNHWKQAVHGGALNSGVTCSSLKDCWLAYAVASSNSVVFLNTDSVPARESKTLHFIQNDIEAQLVQQIVSSFMACGVPEHDIGVVSPYKAQLRTIRGYLKSHPLVEILTVDRYQGRDKTCIIVSLVRSNSMGHMGDLLQDWRRVNVALTRAKCKLVLVGSFSTLKQAALFGDIFRQLAENNWIFHLPKNAHLLHKDEGMESQSSSRPISDQQTS
ncbi:hypothetical protein BASA50_004445 [Batrachochytrium salamandrivorans]|uniref:DNA replication ATP-dependent helicase/nuclease n=1 Tax=Batrachochytrium salamandrivorans TaxID=1357716 RepID=A0ABQ8FFS1_9FUNG|nr:hypothetical protein BASA50_004445 [Batrachochytrium salamandrivorans]